MTPQNLKSNTSLIHFKCSDYCFIQGAKAFLVLMIFLILWKVVEHSGLAEFALLVILLYSATRDYCNESVK
jgi:hypothetical protein